MAEKLVPYEIEIYGLKKTKFSEEEEDILMDYIDSSYEEINSDLSKNKVISDKLQKKIDIIDSAFNKAPFIKDTIILYRGVRKLREGLNKSFMSATFSKYSALHFCAIDFKEEEMCELEPDLGIYVMIMSPGIKYLDLTDFSNKPGEKEILLPRNLNISLINSYIFNNVRHYVVNVTL